MGDRLKTKIEQVCEEAGLVGSEAQVVLYYPDGSYLSAPVLEVGADWVRVAGVRDNGFVIDTSDASIAVDRSPAGPKASGPRLQHVAISYQVPTALERAAADEVPSMKVTNVTAIGITWPDSSYYKGPVAVTWPDRVAIDIEGERIVLDAAGVEAVQLWDDSQAVEFGGPQFERFSPPTPGM